MNDFRMLETSTLSCSVMTMKEEMFAVKQNEPGVPELDKVNVEHIVNCAEGEKEGENLEIETVERDSSCGECGEDLCLPSPRKTLQFPSEAIGGIAKLIAWRFWFRNCPFLRVCSIERLLKFLKAWLFLGT